MLTRESGACLELDTDRLADEKSVEAVLIAWGIERTAIGRILKEHRVRRAREQSATAQICPLIAMGARMLNASESRTH
ncbi:MAG: hypothetical protein M3362_09955 [Acidobacteriota bacterium]|nr:hypothetical protein [Acidobacteriota bacterium]